MTTASWDSDLIEICALLGIGIPQRTPQSVTGGLLHRMWRIETESGMYAVKVLNPEVMSRPDAKRNFRLSERIAQAAYRNDIRAVPAKTIGNEPWVELNGKYVMVFDWVDGHTLLPEKCTSEHSKRIGEVLFQIHNLDVVIDGLELPTFSTVPVDTWKGHIEKARRDTACWGFSCETLLHDVSNWSCLYQDAVDNLSQQLVISHRDLDPKNVIWNNENTPYLIDWESAGYVNPTVELIEVALNWSRNQDGTSNKERFQAVIEAYVEAGGTLHGKMLDAVYGSLGGMLVWLEYNMRRSLAKDVFTIDDRELGYTEVLHTVHDLKNLNETVSDYAEWIEEVS
jgi:Ser/Thr protein kinase RdoA (MazF antagonist)